MRRREFLKGVAIIPAGVTAAYWSAADETRDHREKSARISAVLFDERYADCRAFADVLAQHGAVAFPTPGDAVSVWYTALRRHLLRHGGSVAGMTTDSDLVSSRECGRELKLEIVYEGSHDGRASDRLVHRLHGNGVEREVYAALLRAEKPWAESVASGLSRSSLIGRLVGSVAAVATVSTLESTGHPGYITSWLLERDLAQSQPAA